MKRYLLIMLAALFCAGAIASPASVSAAEVFIDIGDRPYYTHGPWYSYHGNRLYWAPGHWGWHHHHHVWVHGYYVRR
jgi:hypothetical protein